MSRSTQRLIITMDASTNATTTSFAERRTPAKDLPKLDVRQAAKMGLVEKTCRLNVDYTKGENIPADEEDQREVIEEFRRRITGNDSDELPAAGHLTQMERELVRLFDESKDCMLYLVGDVFRM